MEKHRLGLTRFVERFPHLVYELEKKGWEFDEYRRKWVRRKTKEK